MEHIIFTGFMGAGKTTLGKALAKELFLPFVDTDQQIEKEQGVKISDIFAKEGEAFFRGLEHEQLKKLLGAERSIISVGGGLPVQERNQQLLAQLGTVIYLKASKETLLKRLSGDTSRPLLQGGELDAKITRLMREREHIYEKTASHIIETDEKTAGEVITQIRQTLDI